MREPSTAMIVRKNLLQTKLCLFSLKVNQAKQKGPHINLKTKAQKKKKHSFSLDFTRHDDQRVAILREISHQRKVILSLQNLSDLPEYMKEIFWERLESLGILKKVGIRGFNTDFAITEFECSLMNQWKLD